MRRPEDDRYKRSAARIRPATEHRSRRVGTNPRKQSSIPWTKKARKLAPKASA
jgi:hypothetical protein